MKEGATQYVSDGDWHHVVEFTQPGYRDNAVFVDGVHVSVIEAIQSLPSGDGYVLEFTDGVNFADRAVWEGQPDPTNIARLVEAALGEDWYRNDDPWRFVLRRPTDQDWADVEALRAIVRDKPSR